MFWAAWEEEAACTLSSCDLRSSRRPTVLKDQWSVPPRRASGEMPRCSACQERLTGPLRGITRRCRRHPETGLLALGICIRYGSGICGT